MRGGIHGAPTSSDDSAVINLTSRALFIYEANVSLIMRAMRFHGPAPVLVVIVVPSMLLVMVMCVNVMSVLHFAVATARSRFAMMLARAFLPPLCDMLSDEASRES